jgi:hypothetical protein
LVTALGALVDVVVVSEYEEVTVADPVELHAARTSNATTANLVG